MDTLVSRRAPSNTSDPSSNSLCSDDNITAWIASATAAMGALKEVWRNPHLDVFTKYLLFQAIPMNLLLWGVETWSLRLRKSQLDELEVFLHHSIRRILQISISAVKEEKLSDVLFYPMRTKHDCGPTDGLHKKNGVRPPQPTVAEHDHCLLRPQTTSRAATNDGKNFMVQNLQLLFRYVNRNTPIGA